ncbi:MAG: serine/threonine protein kinase [Chloracidobacterium sp.]|nr:serine/threonine protein kinase [Chloracidobacterium sp.]
MIEAGTFLQQRYRIDKKIGQGGMGAVYVATDERFGSTVAIKETLCMDDNFRKAIEREARLLNSLKHSALPRVSDHFEESDGLFLVMEYIPGDDVGSMLDPEKQAFTVEQVQKWADQLLDALDYLHNQEMPVIHRDIKPQNLKVTPRGDIILLDFGLAKGNPTDAGHATAAKSIFGYSRNYASLEQIQGTGTDPRSDLYSLAATLYHLLTNVSPEDALTRAMAVLSQKDDPLVPANVLNPDVPRGIAGVLQKAMSLNADERPATASDMRQMFRESENYAYLADPATIAISSEKTSALGQGTQVVPDATQAGSIHSTDAKTEILPANLSQMTSVKAGDKAAQRTNVAAAHLTSAPPKRKYGFAAGALGMLLVGAAVASGLYLFKPSVFGITPTNADKTAGTTADVPVVVDTTAVANANANANANSAQASAASSASTANKTESRTADTNTRSGETATNDKPDPDTVTIVDEDGSTVQFPAPGKTGNVVVTEKNADGTTTTSVIRNTQLPPNMQRPPNQGGPLPPGFDPRKLTPEQRRRYKAYIQRNGRPPTPGQQPQQP